jgi:hypothetical protein
MLAFTAAWAFMGGLGAAAFYWWLGRRFTIAILAIRATLFVALILHAEPEREPLFTLPPLAAFATYVLVLCGPRPRAHRS